VFEWITPRLNVEEESGEGERRGRHHDRGVVLGVSLIIVRAIG
jgi:hypothetical protein